MAPQVTMVANPVIDLSLAVEALPVEAGKHQNVKEAAVVPGGPANALFVAARLGLRMTLLGTVGQDDLAGLVIKWMARENIGTGLLRHSADWSTCLSVVVVDPAGPHTFLSFTGQQSGPAVLPPDWRASLQSAGAIMLDGWGYRSLGPEPPLDAAALGRAAGIPVFFDPGPDIRVADQEWVCAVLSNTRVLLLTEDEAALILGTTAGPAEMAAALRAMGPEMVVLKRGEAGILVQTADETAAHEGFRVPVRDTTGAGDSVYGATVYAYLRGCPPAEMAAIANAAGAAAVQKLGAGFNVPRRSEMQALLQQAGLPYTLKPV